MSNQSEREETLVEQLQIRDKHIAELQTHLAECINVMADLAKAGEIMLDLWHKQQARLVVLEAAVSGPTFPILPKDKK